MNERAPLFWLAAVTAVVAIAMAVGGCGADPTPPTTTTTAGDAADGKATGAKATCDANTKASFKADNSDSAIVKGGSQGNLNPSIDDMLALLYANGISAQDAPASILPIVDPVRAGVLCPSGEFFVEGTKLGGTKTNIFTRSPENAIKTISCNVEGRTSTVYLHHVRDVLTEPAPILVSVVGSDNAPTYVSAVDLNNLAAIDWNKV
jgi:hypothetical protein